MIDAKTLLVLKGCTPLGKLLCVGEPEPADDLNADWKDGLGISSMTVLDLEGDISHDLNEPYLFSEQFDTVFDCGTIEHVANIGQALKTLLSFVKVGGNIAIQTVADSQMNHGFYQPSPQLFYELLSANGFTTSIFSYRVGPFARLFPEPRDSSQGFNLSLPRYQVVAGKRHAAPEFHWPIQPAFLRGKPERIPALRSAWSILKSAFVRI